MSTFYTPAQEKHSTDNYKLLAQSLLSSAKHIREVADSGDVTILDQEASSLFVEEYQTLSQALLAKTKWVAAAQQLTKPQKLEMIGLDNEAYKSIRSVAMGIKIRRFVLPKIQALRGAVGIDQYPYGKPVPVIDPAAVRPPYFRNGLWDFVNHHRSTGSINNKGLSVILGMNLDDMNSYDSADYAMNRVIEIRPIVQKVLNPDQHQWKIQVQWFAERADDHQKELERVSLTGKATPDFPETVELAKKYLEMVPA